MSTDTPPRRRYKPIRKFNIVKDGDTKKQVPVEAKPKAKSKPKPKAVTYAPCTLAYIFIRTRGGHRAALQSFERCYDRDEAQVREFVNRFYDKSQREQDDPEVLDIICKEMKFPPHRFLEWVVGQTFRVGLLSAEYIKALELPAVLQTSLDVAQTPEGFDDRTALLKAAGHHHAAQGASINIDNRKQEINLKQGLPVYEETVHQLAEVLEAVPALPPAPEPVTVSVDQGELIDVEPDDSTAR